MGMVCVDVFDDLFDEIEMFGVGCVIVWGVVMFVISDVGVVKFVVDVVVEVCDVLIGWLFVVMLVVVVVLLYFVVLGNLFMLGDDVCFEYFVVVIKVFVLFL